MRRTMWVATGAAALMIGAAVPATAADGPWVAPTDDTVPAIAANSDSPSHPLGDRQATLHERAVAQKLNGKAVGPVAEVAKGQFVQLERQGEDTIWTVLGEFGDTVNPTYGGSAGPVHNQIAQPDRTVDNTTIWNPDFSASYYQNLLFSQSPGAISMRNFYIEESSNRYTVKGTVEDWVKLPNNAANYGANYCGGIVCARTWLFVRDTVNTWYAAQLAAGKSPAQVADYLSQFDTWDRYDYDHDGNYNEADGYIDHFQAVHAGEGEETGGGPQGTDAIWSHRWYAFYNNVGATGPAGNLLGGVKIGGTNLWIGDYTVEPENGGIGVFTHEYGHDLGLPDLYDTSGNTGGGENSTGFWTLYSSGSYGSTGQPADGIGSKPIPMSAYEKLFLGWSNYTVVQPNQKASVKLGPSTANTKQGQALVALLPDKVVAADMGATYAGSYQYFSGTGNNIDNTMTRSVTLPAGAPVTMTAKVRYDIEYDYDYAFVTVNGTRIPTNLLDPASPGPNNAGITGSSNDSWVDLSVDLSAYAGQTVTIGFEYLTDGGVSLAGFFADDIAIAGQALDGAETDPGWAFTGFARVQQIVNQSYTNAYFAEFRTYKGYDAGLRTGPYNFGDPQAAPNWVEHFPYQDGLLVWYYDTSFPDNNVGDYCAAGRCGGLYLPVDAHPALMLRPDDGQVWRPRVQSYDSTFGLEATDKICLHASGIGQCYGPLAATPVFDDSQSYWVAPDASIGNQGWASVQVPHTGTKIRVKSVSAQGTFMQVMVNQ